MVHGNKLLLGNILCLDLEFILLHLHTVAMREMVRKIQQCYCSLTHSHCFK